VVALLLLFLLLPALLLRLGLLLQQLLVGVDEDGGPRDRDFLRGTVIMIMIIM
jgi:hypothetical protein